MRFKNYPVLVGLVVEAAFVLKRLRSHHVVAQMKQWLPEMQHLETLQMFFKMISACYLTSGKQCLYPFGTSSSSDQVLTVGTMRPPTTTTALMLP